MVKLNSLACKPCVYLAWRLFTVRASAFRLIHRTQSLTKDVMIAGNIAQAASDVSVANHYIRAFVPKDAAAVIGEYRDCALSLAVLQRYQASVLPLDQSSHPSLSPAESEDGLARSYRTRANLRTPWVDEGDCQMSSGISKVVRELSNVWHMARVYAAGRRTEPECPPPWMPDSEYANVMIEHQNWESRVPRDYRFAVNRFDQLDDEDLQKHRAYWSPWVHTQMLFPGILCLLNHPFLLAMRLREFRQAIPQSFMQSSYEQTTRHAGWIMYFIELLHKKSYEMADPVVAHCVVIVATIQLQHSFVQDAELSYRSQTGFTKCLAFLQKMGCMVPVVAEMVGGGTARNVSTNLKR